jgi:peptidoglycan L-alanyl-D-glutamate endopeptidase CwlK
MSREINDLEPETRVRAGQVLAWCWSHGIAAFLTSTLRTHADQESLWLQGRETPGPVVTNAPPYHSWHETGRAFDLAALITPSRKATWDLPWEAIAAYAESIGLEWGGRWTRFGDRDHFQFTAGLLLAEAMKEQDERSLA